MEEIRAFIAVALPPEIKNKLVRLQGQLREGTPVPVKWVAPESMHLTLKFLGNISPGLTGRVTAAIGEAARGEPPLKLGIEGLGVFPNPRRVQVVWVGLSGDVARLGELQKRLETGLQPLGFRPEGRPFAPHLTLGRVRDRATPPERQALGEMVTTADFEDESTFLIDAVHLMRSQLTRQGPIYSRISSVKLE
jgi:2'-5' RNA ligase